LTALVQVPLEAASLPLLLEKLPLEALLPEKAAEAEQVVSPSGLRGTMLLVSG